MPPRTRRSDDFRELRELVARHAAPTGVFTRADLRAWLIDPSAIRTMLRRRHWERLHHGVYVDRVVLEHATTPLARASLVASAAIRALEGPATVMGLTAAALHDLPLPSAQPASVEILRPGHSDHRALAGTFSAAGLTPVFVSRDGADARVMRAGIPCLPLADAAFTAACRLRREWAVALFDAVLWERPEAAASLEAAANRWSTLRGAAEAGRLVRRARTGAQTPLESISRIRLVDRGLPEPELQVPFHDRDGLIGVVDLYFPALGVVGEADGLAKYETRDTLVREKLREDRLRRLGLGIARWTWQEIWESPAVVVARIRAASSGVEGDLRESKPRAG